jgi:hypothetical protein
MLLLFVTLLLVIVTAWNYSIMRKLGIAEKTYKTSDDFLTHCQVSLPIVNVGKISSGILLVFGLILMIYISIRMIRNK